VIVLSAIDRFELFPQRDAGAVSSVSLSLLIHAALFLALTWGVNWKRSDDITFDAELWPIVQSEPAPAPNNPPSQEAVPLPASGVNPPVVQAPTEPPPNVRNAQAPNKNSKQPIDQQLTQEKTVRDKAKASQAHTQKTDTLSAEHARAGELNIKQSQQANTRQLEDESRNRMRSLLARPGDNAEDKTSRATAGDNGMFSNYGAIARAAIMPNVVFTEAFNGNPLAKVQVSLQSDGTIINARLVQGSGNKSWDNAILNAVIRTRVMPKDVDGKLPDRVLILELTPRFR
jgi:colicin import membrane protein